MRKIMKCIYDPIFKSIFMDNPNALASLISSITEIDYNLMKDNITIRANEIPISNKYEKFKKCDFIVSFDKYIINLEANGFNSKIIKTKNASYAMKVYSENTKISFQYGSKLVVIRINLNAFSINNKVLTKYYISDPITGEIYLQNFAFYTLDLEKCYKIFYNTDNKENISNYVRWGAFLYNEDMSEINNILGDILSSRDKGRLIRKIDEINMRKDGTLTRKEAKEWGRWIENSFRQEGLEKGFEQGRVEGIERGIEQGIEKGIIDTIKSMLKNELSYETISEITNKTIDEIKEIEK